MRPPSRFTVKVVGLTFVDGYPDNLTALERAWYDRSITAPAGQDPEPLPAVLRPNPENGHDPNAVEVHVPSVGMLGHVPARLAERLSPCLLDGEDWQASVEEVLVHPDNPDRPGISVLIQHVTAA